MPCWIALARYTPSPGGEAARGGAALAAGGRRERRRGGDARLRAGGAARGARGARRRRQRLRRRRRLRRRQRWRRRQQWRRWPRRPFHAHAAATFTAAAFRSGAWRGRGRGGRGGGRRGGVRDVARRVLGRCAHRWRQAPSAPPPHLFSLSPHLPLSTRASAHTNTLALYNPPSTSPILVFHSSPSPTLTPHVIPPSSLTLSHPHPSPHPTPRQPRLGHHKPSPGLERDDGLRRRMADCARVRRRRRRRPRSAQLRLVYSRRVLERPVAGWLWARFVS